MPEQPLPPPPSHPDEPPFVCVQINQHWIPYIIGLLRPAKFPEYWAGTLDENRNARRDVQNLIDQFQVMEECGDMTICCEDAVYIYRINPDDGHYERSSDGGTTWTPDPEDPASKIRQLPPIVRDTVPATKCDASTNILEHFEDILILQSEQLGTAITVFELAVAVAGLLLEIFLIVITGGASSPYALTIAAAIWAAATAALNEGKTAFDDYWDNDNKDIVLCAIYCNIGDDGRFTEAQFAQYQHKVKADLPPGAARDFGLTAAHAGGAAGFNQMAAYGNAANADCTSCGCNDICATRWNVPSGVENVSGEITSRNETENTIDVQSTNINTDNKYYIVIQTDNIDSCCILNSAVANPNGPSDPNPAWIECGRERTIANISYGLIGTHCANYIYWASTTPFQLRLTFTEC